MNRLILLKADKIDTAEQYLLSIPLEERKQVKIIICDMYETYIRFAGSYFPNAIAIVDSFHVISKLNSLIRNYINSVKKRYQRQDRKKLQEENYRNNHNFKTRKESREVTLIRKYDWLLLKDEDDIENWDFRHYVPGFSMKMDLLQIQTVFMSLDKNFEYINTMRMKYIRFNRNHLGKPEEAAIEFDQLIREYQASPLALFREFAGTLSRYRTEILASFTAIEVMDPKTGEMTLRRLSNGPMESFNNFPKDLKRECNGVKNPDYTINRVLFARRTNPSVLAVPRPLSSFVTPGKPRGKYKK